MTSGDPWRTFVVAGNHAGDTTKLLCVFYFPSPQDTDSPPVIEEMYTHLPIPRLHSKCPRLRDGILRNYPPRKLPECDVLLDIHLLAQVGLREHRQRVPRDAPAAAGRGLHAPDKVRHRPEPPRR